MLKNSLNQKLAFSIDKSPDWSLFIKPLTWSYISSLQMVMEGNEILPLSVIVTLENSLNWVEQVHSHCSRSDLRYCWRQLSYAIKVKKGKKCPEPCLYGIIELVEGDELVLYGIRELAPATLWSRFNQWEPSLDIPHWCKQRSVIKYQLCR